MMEKRFERLILKWLFGKLQLLLRISCYVEIIITLLHKCIFLLALTFLMHYWRRQNLIPQFSDHASLAKKYLSILPVERSGKFKLALHRERNTIS